MYMCWLSVHGVDVCCDLDAMALNHVNGCCLSLDSARILSSLAGHLSLHVSDVFLYAKPSFSFFIVSHILCVVI